ncbi:MAG TPA: ATP-binding protein, partial [Casimicrobiaceae bacterium]|nr:ATP-binding protein [Casimicrobiaceae bacterium]
LVALAFFLFGVALTARILVSGRESVARRFIGMVADNAVTSYCLIRMGEGGAVILGVYLFITFGNGFRFGRVYLHACQVLALLGFCTVLAASSFWSQHLAIGIGLVVALVVLPFYVGVLAERINEARRRADDANKAKGRFLANVSHEMRTPLNGVIAMADVLRDTSLNDSQREIVETLGTSAHLLLVQIEDVLDMAKIEAGRVQISRSAFDLGALITSTVKVVLPQARFKGLAVAVDVPPELNRWFEGDAHHLRQVLLNLLANAVKFTEKGEVHLDVSQLALSDTQATVRFEVRDTGIGIPVDKQAAIFEPFTQADDSITRVYGGTGLGTTIARQLVTLMGGTIGLESTPGVGSRFWVDVPFALTEARDADPVGIVGDGTKLTALARAIGEDPAKKVTKIRGARILVAEDNATNQRVAELVLESGGHRPTIVGNGEAALDELAKGGYDLALFDLSMPVVSGLEALKLYRFTTDKPIPVLMLSANVTTEVITECNAAGAAEFIAKPLRPSTLLAAIERHLASRAGELEAPIPARSEDRPALTVVDTPPVDQSVLADLDRLSPDPTFISRLLNGFRSDAERLVKEIVDALATRKYELLKDSAHALKGGAGSVGATQLMMIATRFEKATHEMLRLNAAKWTEELTKATDAALVILDQHVEIHRRRTGG